MPTPTLAATGLRPALLALAMTLLAPALWPAADLTAKDHSIFVGLDVSIILKGKQYPVVGVDRNAIRIMMDHKETIVPMAMAKDIRIKQGVKLSNLSASVANLRGIEGVARLLSTDEMGQMHDAAVVQFNMEAQRDKAMIDMSSSDNFPFTPDPNSTDAAPPPPRADPPSLSDMQNKIGQMAKATNDALESKVGPGSGLGGNGFAVSFEVSAPVPLEQCFAAIVASYTLPGGSNKAFNKISLHPLGQVGPAARKVSSELRGFPEGAELKSYRVGLYSGGLEVATNVSARRTEVTRDEAVVFLTMDYLAKHPGETLPPAPVLMVPRLEFATTLGSAPRDKLIYARVGKDGRIIRFSTDAAGSNRLPSELSPALDQIAFVPALEKGKPIEGVAKFKLADLVAAN